MVFHILTVGEGNFSFSLAFALQILENKEKYEHLLKIARIGINQQQKELLDLNLNLNDNAHLMENNANVENWTDAAGSTAMISATSSTTSSCSFQFDKDDALHAPEDKVFLTATSYDSFHQVTDKYGQESIQILMKLNSKSLKKLVDVRHNHENFNQHEKNTTKFNAIIWNHPHLGLEDFNQHHFLLCHFFHSALAVLSESDKDAFIRVVLVQGQERRWNLFKAAEKCGLVLVDLDLFDEKEWPGYVVKRNKNGESFKNLRTRRHVRTIMKSGVFTFQRGPHPGSISMAGMDAKLDVFYGQGFDSTFNLKPEVTGLVTDDLIESKKKPTLRQSLPMGPKRVQGPRDITVPIDLICPYCYKQLSNSRSYTQHVYMVHILEKFGSDWRPDRPLNCHCPECAKVFKDKEALYQHTVNKHSKLDLNTLLGMADENDEMGSQFSFIPCNVCGQACIDSVKGYHQHLDNFKPVMGKNMKCGECGDAFIEERALIQHFKFCRAANVKKL